MGVLPLYYLLSSTELLNWSKQPHSKNRIFENEKKIPLFLFINSVTTLCTAKLYLFLKLEAKD